MPNNIWQLLTGFFRGIRDLLGDRSSLHAVIGDWCRQAHLASREERNAKVDALILVTLPFLGVASGLVPIDLESAFLCPGSALRRTTVPDRRDGRLPASLCQPAPGQVGTTECAGFRFLWTNGLHLRAYLHANDLQSLEVMLKVNSSPSKQARDVHSTIALVSCY
jgi:hypothetical protein